MALSISAQAGAIDAAIRVISGAAPKPTRKEQEFLCGRLSEALLTLRWIESREAQIKAALAKREAI